MTQETIDIPTMRNEGVEDVFAVSIKGGRGGRLEGMLVSSVREGEEIDVLTYVDPASSIKE
jgi:hypothetical protein